MSRIVVSVMPFAGHVAPVTAVVAELVARGHEVAVYTGSRHLARFEALGARGIPWSAAPDFDEHDLTATFPELGRRGRRGLLANVEHLFIRSAEGQALDLLAAHAETPFELVVSDVMSLGGGLAAESAGIPWATLSIVPLSLPSIDLPPSGLGLLPGIGGVGTVRDGALRLVFRIASAPLERAHRQVRTALHLAPATRRIDEAWYSPWLVAATGSPSLEYPRTDLGAQFHFVGRLARRAPDGAAQADNAAQPTEKPAWWPELLANRLPTVLVTQGTFNTDPQDLIVPTLEALSSEPVLVLATTTAESLPHGVPANAKAAPFLPFDEVLPLTDAVVTNGGWGGVLEALAHGIPLIVAGGDLDKPEIAARVAWARAGLDLRTAHPSARAVAKAYATIRGDESFADRARMIARELAELGGATATAELLEALLATGEPVLRTTGPWG